MHQEREVVGKQIAKDVGALPAAIADEEWMPEVICIGDMGDGKAFYIHSNSWFGGDTQVLQMGRIPYQLKLAYKEMFFRNSGKVWTQWVTYSLINLGRYGSACWARTSDPLINRLLSR